MINHYRFAAGKFPVVLTSFKLIGSDVTSFLQSQVTYDVSLIGSGAFHLASWLDPQGRIESYGWLAHQSEQEYLYLTPPALKSSALERLQRYLISEDVDIQAAGDETWFVVVGAEAREHGSDQSFAGEMFADEALLMRSDPGDIPLIPPAEVETWRGLNGWPEFNGSSFQKHLINNGRLYDLTVVKKGCYPGQETVSKIATHRGAAYSPVLLESQTPSHPGTMSLSGSKIGTVSDCYQFEGKYYLAAQVLRDFRVEKMKINFSLNEKERSATVRYYPLLSGCREDKARELFYSASEHFKNDQLEAAEADLRLALKLDPGFGDAYESLGVMLGRQERFQEAIDLMKKLSEVDPDSVMAHTNQSLYLMRLGKIEEAEEQKSEATLKSFRQFGAQADAEERTQAEIQRQHAEWEQRENMFKQVLEIDPEDTLANYGIGSIAVEKKDWNRARAHLEKVLQVDPKYSVAYLALGKTYAALGSKDEARETFRQGIKVAASRGDLMPANQMQSELERL